MRAGPGRAHQIPVFLSHSTSGDGALCALLASELLRHQVDPWFAHGAQGIGVGDDWEGRLRAEIDRCEVLVVLASRHIHESKWCRREAQYAAGRGKHILVVRVDDYPLPGWIEFLGGERQHLSLQRTSLQDVAHDLARLCSDAIEGHLNPGEDRVESLDLPFEVAARGHVHTVVIQRGANSGAVQVVIPPCGKSQVVRHNLGGESTLSVYVRVLPSERFSLMPDGTSVLSIIEVDSGAFEDGDSIEVQTLDGNRIVAVPPRLRQSGARLHLKGCGVGRRGKSAGDLILELRFPPTPVSDSPDEFMELHRRLSLWASVFAVVAPASAVAAVVGLAPGPTGAVAVIGYSLVGVWIGALAIGQRRLSAVDWGVGIASCFCSVPVFGPALLLWAGWELRLASGVADFRKSLGLHAALAASAWVVCLWGGGDEGLSAGGRAFCSLLFATSGIALHRAVGLVTPSDA